MIKSEPRSILSFLHTHYDLMRELFDLQSEQGLITKENLNTCIENYDRDIKSPLYEYQILIEQNDDFVFNEPYLVLFEFIHQKFKPLLPEEIEQFGTSIRELFLHIKQGIQLDKNILLDRIDALATQIHKFKNAIVNNTKSLLTRSRELKANTNKIEYQEKIKQASFLIDHYILPLNTILDVNHSQSIYNELLSVSQYSNARRFDYGDENIRRQFEKLYFTLRQIQKDLNVQSVIISNELLPLIERIRTESRYLRGFHHYLTNGRCYKEIKPPNLFTTGRQTVYHAFIKENAREYIEQFQKVDQIVIEEDGELEPEWIFDKNRYKTRLDQSLPVEDFFEWCEEGLAEENQDFSFDQFFMVTGLVFEEDYDVVYHASTEHTVIVRRKTRLVLPKIGLQKSAHVS